MESGEMFGGAGVAALNGPRKYHSAVVAKVTTLEPQSGNCLEEVSGHGSTLAEDVGHLTSFTWSIFIRYSSLGGRAIKVLRPGTTSP